MYTNDAAAIKIQRYFRHFLEGRRIRERLKYNVHNIWNLKSYAVMCVLDNRLFLRLKSYREYVDRVYKSIQVWLHQDSDDEEDYSLTDQQIDKIRYLQEKSHINYKDIKNLLKLLTIDQLQFIQ